MKILWRHWSRGLLLFVLAFLIGCQSDESFSDIDRNFVASMVPHHQVGMELLDHGARRVDDVRVRNLIFQMSSYHHHEFAQLEAYRDRWGIVEAASFPGQLVVEDWNRVNSTNGTEYDISWLKVMIFHHHGAIELAQGEMSKGIDETLVSMAADISSEQQSQIAQMEKLLTELCADIDTDFCEI